MTVIKKCKECGRYDTPDHAAWQLERENHHLRLLLAGKDKALGSFPCENCVGGINRTGACYMCKGTGIHRTAAKALTLTPSEGLNKVREALEWYAHKNTVSFRKDALGPNMDEFDNGNRASEALALLGGK